MKTKSDLWLLPMIGDHQPEPLLQTEFNETQAQFSPDGRWVAYTSDESGDEQIYVQPFPPSGGHWQVSNSGGRQPRWRGDGKELFYLAPDGTLMVVAIRSGSTSGTHFEWNGPQHLFRTGTRTFLNSQSFNYDVTADGRRVLVNTPPDEGTQSVNVVVNWTAELKRN